MGNPRAPINLQEIQLHPGSQRLDAAGVVSWSLRLGLGLVVYEIPVVNFRAPTDFLLLFLAA